MENLYLKVNQEPKTFQLRLKSLPESDEMGIYRLYYFEDGKPKEIQRFVSKDQQGVLYIGMTDGPLLHRVGNLQKALVGNSKPALEKPASSGHTQMGKKYYRIRKKINIDDLYIKIFPDINPKQAETDAIEKYVNEFAELPPLNGQYGSFEPEWSMFL
tara:strand:+ start:10728 stop:11201 length:474 start_codon:yes stop_codon:yes gene_type:complete